MKKELERWIIILNAIGFKQENHEIAAQYAQNFTQSTNVLNTLNEYNNLLPLNLRLLSKLDFDNKVIVLIGCDESDTIEHKVYLSDKYENIESCTDIIIDELFNILNEKNIIGIFRLINSISHKKDEKGYYISVTSRIKI